MMGKKKMKGRAIQGGFLKGEKLVRKLTTLHVNKERQS